MGSMRELLSGNSHPGPPHEPSEWRAAFTPLQLPMLRDLGTLKRRERRAPVQGFNARIRSGNSLPGEGEFVSANGQYARSGSNPVQRFNAWTFVRGFLILASPREGTAMVGLRYAGGWRAAPALDACE